MGARCKDCGDAEYETTRRTRVSGNRCSERHWCCDVCWEVRMQFVRAMDNGLIPIEQAQRCQRGGFRRRKMMQDAIAEGIHNEEHPNPAPAP